MKNLSARKSRRFFCVLVMCILTFIVGIITCSAAPAEDETALAQPDGALTGTAVALSDNSAQQALFEVEGNMYYIDGEKPDGLGEDVLGALDYTRTISVPTPISTSISTSQ